MEYKTKEYFDMVTQDFLYKLVALMKDAQSVDEAIKAHKMISLMIGDK
ncbi:hypothetical protein J3T26_09870 [Salmonella enterica]|nr:hypothetical protein [Salmonella enterica]MCU7121051.1 hypothetical protein [Salmonella enterica]